jgi:hypothetical protein
MSQFNFRPFRWAWQQVKKKGTYTTSMKDMYRMTKKYNKYVIDNVNVWKLIRKFDQNKDEILDEFEIQLLLTVSFFRALYKQYDLHLLLRICMQIVSANHLHPGTSST